MSYNITSWFIDQLALPATAPRRMFWVGSTNYSDRVLKWPKIERISNKFTTSTINMTLANDDGYLNTFYALTYHTYLPCCIQLGFSHPTSGDEMITLYQGKIDFVSYPNEGQCQIKLRDRLYDFMQAKVGDTEIPVSMGSQSPSEIAWTLCTCYGGLSNVRSTSNPDIDYARFGIWAAQFSADTIRCAGYYKGDKITKALESVAGMTDSCLWVDGNNKIAFARWVTANTLDVVIDRTRQAALIIDVEKGELVNKQYVGFNYAVTSDYWRMNVVSVRSLSITSYGLHENILQDESIWFCDSVSALNLAQRLSARYQYPPKMFKVTTGLWGLYRDIGETVRLVSSFYNITSAGGYRIVEIIYDMEQGKTTFVMDDSAISNAFYLDVSTLDGTDLLL